MVSDTDSSVRVNAVFSSFASRRVADKYVAEGSIDLQNIILQVVTNNILDHFRTRHVKWKDCTAWRSRSPGRFGRVG